MTALVLLPVVVVMLFFVVVVMVTFLHLGRFDRLEVGHWGKALLTKVVFNCPPLHLVLSDKTYYMIIHVTSVINVIGPVLPWRPPSIPLPS